MTREEHTKVVNDTLRPIALKAIDDNNIDLLNIIILNKNFDINERFDTPYLHEENYLHYCICFQNKYNIARIILNTKFTMLNKKEIEDMAIRLVLDRKINFLYDFIRKYDSTIKKPDCIDAVRKSNFTRILSKC